MSKRIIESELSYKIMSILFDVHTKLGNQYQEKHYQRAIEMAFNKAKLQYKKQVCVDLLYDNNKIGKYFLDFIVENKIIVELKTVSVFRYQDVRQVLAYLKLAKLPLGILVNFRSQQLSYKRILNPEAI